MTIVTFPGLDIELSVNRVAFTIFGIEIYWYGVIIVLGIILAVAFGMSQVKRFGIDSDKLIDVIFIGLITAIIGGRLYYIVFSDQSYNSFYDIINMRAGGIGIYGAVIGAFIGAFIGCKARKVPVLPTMDLAAMGFLIGQSVGRWANFVNQEAFGDNTSLPWGMQSSATESYLSSVQSKLAALGVQVDPSMPVHPTFLYESLWCALGFLILFLYKNKRKFNGELTLMYVLWYGVGRAFIEGLRTDPLTISNTGVRVSQMLAVMSAVMALLALIACYIMTRGKPLNVPEVPDRKLKVKLKDGGEAQVVYISWPANTKEPSKQERERLAREELAKKDSPEESPEDEEQEGEEEEQESPADEAREDENEDIEAILTVEEAVLGSETMAEGSLGASEEIISEEIRQKTPAPEGAVNKQAAEDAEDEEEAKSSREYEAQAEEKAAEAFIEEEEEKL